MEIRTADFWDFDLLQKNDRHIGPDALRASLAAGRVLVAYEGGYFAGWMRWNLFWDEIPFLNMLFLLEPYRGQGLGRALMAEWEARMCAQGYEQVMTSTQANECAQHFYRRLGYADIGAFALPGDPLELIFVKDLPQI